LKCDEGTLAAEASTSFKKSSRMKPSVFLKEALARDESLVALGHIARPFLESSSPDPITHSNEARITGFQPFRKNRRFHAAAFF
jgi:hypothetical protein